MRKKQPKIIENATNVIEFFRDAGFSDTHIRKVISLKPRVLSSSVEETLKPKFRPFEDLGLSSPEIRDFMINNVLYLRRSADSTIAVLSTLFETKEDVARVIMKNRFPPTWTCRRNLDTQISKYLEHGVSKEKLVRFLANEPSLIMIRAESIEERIQKAYKMGFKYGDSLLMAAVKVIGSMNESTLESKFQVLRSYGWEESEIYMAFQRSPWFLAISVEKMRRTLKFFMEDLKYEPFDLASRPAVFNLSFDKRILPRYNFIKDLESRGIQKRKYNLLTFVRLTERRFQEVFLLDIKDEHPELFKSYLKSIGQD